MFEFIISFGFVGIMFLALGALYLAYVGFMYFIYKKTNGKMKFKEYIKYW